MESFLCVSRSCANSQIVRRREEVWIFRVDHDICCETQLLELVSLNSVVHVVSAVFVSILLSDCVLSSTQKVSRVSVFSLLYCFQLIRRQILHFSQHSMLSLL